MLARMCRDLWAFCQWEVPSEYPIQHWQNASGTRSNEILTINKSRRYRPGACVRSFVSSASTFFSRSVFSA
jgi:hypothetical protein